MKNTIERAHTAVVAVLIVAGLLLMGWIEYTL
jgi:hypothetical protein